MSLSVEEQRAFDEINARLAELEYHTGLKTRPSAEEIAAQQAAEVAAQPATPNVDTEARAGVQRVESKLDDILSFIKGAPTQAETVERPY